MRPATFSDLMRYALLLTLILAACEWASGQSVWRNAVLYNYSNVTVAETTMEVAILDGTGEIILLDGSGETLVFDLN